MKNLLLLLVVLLLVGCNRCGRVNTSYATKERIELYHAIQSLKVGRIVPDIVTANMEMTADTESFTRYIIYNYVKKPNNGKFGSLLVGQRYDIVCRNDTIIGIYKK